MIKNVLNYIKRKKVMSLFILIVVTGLCIAAAINLKKTSNINTDRMTNKELDSLNLEGYNKLMIVAHPDDESLWGGAHLLEDNYLVVCITNGDNKVREEEFEAVMKKTGDIGIIMSYPDIVGYKKSHWENLKADILLDFDTLINFKDWELIVTHNQCAEYGHIHHSMVHDLVTIAYENSNSKAKLFHFGTYYSPENMPDDLEQIPEGSLNAKMDILSEYKSQREIIEGFRHMIPYELWTEE